MNSAVRRRALVAAPIVALGVAGCGIHEQTQIWYPPANGTNAEAGDIGLRNVLVISDGEGQATVLASLSNDSEADDELTAVAVGDAVVEPAGGTVEIPADGYATIGPDTERVDLQNVDTVPGRMVEVEFRFGSAPRVTVDALVEEAEGMYADALPDEPGSTETPDTETPDTETDTEGTDGEGTDTEGTDSH